MAKQEISISGFLGMNRSLKPHQLNPGEDGDARMHEIVNGDPSELREATPRPAWRLIEEEASPSTKWPRRIDATGVHTTV